MSSTRDRLVTCFAAVFPKLTPAEIERATPLTVTAWDSLANVMLLTVVEEEFGVEVPVEELQTLGSFERLLEFVDAAPRAG